MHLTMNHSHFEHSEVAPSMNIVSNTVTSFKIASVGKRPFWSTHPGSSLNGLAHVIA